MTLKNMIKGGALFVALAFLFGCAGSRPAKEEMVPGAPDWVNRGSGAFEEKDRKLFYGVGSVTGVSNPALEQTSADSRARAELARVLGIYVSLLYKDYQSASTTSEPGKGSEEQHVEQALKTTVDESLRGAKIIDHWRNPKNGVLYALGKLNLDDYKELIGTIKELKPEAKSLIQQRAESAFKALQAEGK